MPVLGLGWRLRGKGGIRPQAGTSYGGLGRPPRLGTWCGFWDPKIWAMQLRHGTCGPSTFKHRELPRSERCVNSRSGSPREARHIRSS